jgi:hypothetical protein
MSIKASSSRVLSMLGGIGLLAGALDPLEGSFVILAGSALLWGGEVMKVPERRQLGLWTSVFVLIAVGVGVMFGLSAAGGIGGRSGRSWWWGVLLLPYPAGWLLGVGGLLAGLLRFLRRRAAARRD